MKYEDDSVESVAESLRESLRINGDDAKKGKEATQAKPISLYDEQSVETHPKDGESEDLFAELPDFDRPKLLQTPHRIPALFPFHRTSVYLFMAPETSHLTPKTVILKGISPQGPLELDITVETRQQPDEMIHQLAARKAIQELEEGRGFISDAVSDTGALMKENSPAELEFLRRREAVRLGVEFQVGGKYCSFVAVEANEAEVAAKRKKALEHTISRAIDSGSDEDWEIIHGNDTVSKSASGKFCCV